MINSAWVAPIRRRLKAWRIQRLINDWKILAGRPDGSLKKDIRRVAIIPGDHLSLIGSKGDEAMLVAVTGQLQLNWPGLEMCVIVSTSHAAAAAEQLGFKPLHIWPKNGFRPMLQGLLDEAVDLLVVVGADVMDGYYSPKTSLQTLAVADLFARSGRPAVILGFSFNAEPAPSVIEMFNGVSNRLLVNVRDPVSWRRFQTMTRAQATLVADIAFLLKPDGSSQVHASALKWVQAQREGGRSVIGFNVHPLLVDSMSPDALEKLINASVAALDRLISSRPVSVVLISHDNRAKQADDVCLQAIYQRIAQHFAERVFYPREPLSAPQLKALAGLMDGVVTGRMHLAVAALGMGVPAAGLTYQGKYQGLFEHFGLPEDMLLPPAKAMDADELYSMLVLFVDRLPELQGKVRSALPDVKRLSLANIGGLEYLNL